MPEGSTYVQWLASLDDAALTSLLTHRPEALARPLRTFNDLASMLANPISIEEALRRLDRSAVQIAGVLGTLGPASVDQLESALARSGAVPAGHVATALDRLTTHGLAWSDAHDHWQVPKALASMGNAMCGFGPPLLHTAERTQFFLLQTALAALGLAPARSARDAVFALSAWARDEAAVRATVKRAPATVRNALEQIAVHGPVRDLDDEASRWLSERCLLVPAGIGLSTVPAELVAFARGDRVVGVVRVEPAPVPAPGADPTRLLDLAGRLRALLNVLDLTPLKSLQSGGIGVQEQRRLARALDVDQDVVRRLLHLTGDAGLVSTGTRPGLVTVDGAAWLERDEVPAAVDVVLAAIDVGRVAADGSEAPLWGPVWRHPRLTLRAALAALVDNPQRPPAAWLTWRWYGADEAEVAAVVAQLEWLGVVTPAGVLPWAAAIVAGDATAAVQAVEAVLPAVQEDVVLQADGTAVVAGRPSAELRRLLDRVARQEAERTWRIEAGCIRAALDDGADPASLLDALRRHSRHPVPQVVERLVHDVAARHGGIVVVPSATLLRIDDEPLAITVLRDRRLKNLGLTEVQPGVLSSPKKAGEVLAALRVAGYAPAGPREPARRRPGASRVQTRPAVARASAPADVVRTLRAAPAAAEPAQATVHQLRAPAQVRGRFDHLPPDQRILLARALTDGGPIEIDYVDSRCRLTTRVVEDLQDLGGLLEGWCQLRDAERNFVPEGIRAVRPAR